MAEKKLGRENWADAWSVGQCSLCSAEFGCLTWKHHCRACGNVFCWKCTNHRIKYTPFMRRHDEGYTEKDKRVCGPCFVSIAEERTRAAEAQIKEADLFKKEVHNQLSAMVVNGDVCHDFRTVKPPAPECLFFNLSDEAGRRLLQDRQVVLFDLKLPKVGLAASQDVEYAPEQPAVIEYAPEQPAVMGPDGLSVQCPLQVNQIYCEYDARHSVLEVQSDPSEATWDSLADTLSETSVEMEASLLDMQFKLADQIWNWDMQCAALGARHEWSGDVLEQQESSILDLQFDIAIRKMELHDYLFQDLDHMYVQCEA